MSDNLLSLQKPAFTEINFKILSFKHPSTFDQKITEKIIQIFKDRALAGKPFISFEEFESIYEKGKNVKEQKKDEDFKRYLYMTNWQKKDQDEIDIRLKVNQESNQHLRDNLRILSIDNIIKSRKIIYSTKDGLQEIKQYFLDQLNNNLTNLTSEISRSEITQFILQRMKESEYPYDTLVPMDKIFDNLVDTYFEANRLLYSLIVGNLVVKIPLLQVIDDQEVYKDFLLSGKINMAEMISFINDHLIPNLKVRYAAIKLKLREVFQQYNFTISEEQISPDHKKEVNLLCFRMLDAKDSISREDFNLAQLILNCWLALEDDPLLALQEYPDVELDKDFLSPFLSHYIHDFSHITDYLKIIKKFVEQLPMVIDRENLVHFFKSKGVQKKVVVSFLDHLPKEIISHRSSKNHYIIAKGMIIKAITYLYDGNYYKVTESGRHQFTILAHIFRSIEITEKNYNQLIDELKTTPNIFKHVKDILSKTDVYKAVPKEEKRSIEPASSPKTDFKDTPSKKIYTNKDFENLEDEDREKLIEALNLRVIECTDHQKNRHQFFIKKGNLNLDDARFFRGNPTYELICKRFSL